MTDSHCAVVAGVDTHKDTCWAALITTTGRRVDDREFPATPAGYRQLHQFLTSHGPLVKAGIEGTNSYGKSLTQTLLDCGTPVVEVIRPKRAQRRRGKSDPIDAYAAAEQALADNHLPTPKTPGGSVDQVRDLLIIRNSAVKARSQAKNQIHSLLITAPVDIREHYRHLKGQQLIAALASCRPGPATIDTCRYALKQLARRVQQLDQEITAYDRHLTTLITAINPQLLATHGVGPAGAAQLLVTAGNNPDRIASRAQFAALAGVSPIPASSGKTNRHRLNRGGDRQANKALHMIVIIRLKTCPTTKAYMQRRTQEGKTKRDIIRCLKRYVADEIYHTLTQPNTPQT